MGDLQTDLARHLDLSTTRLRDLTKRGTIPTGATRDTARVAYIRHLRAQAAGRGSGSASRERFDSAQADLAELKLAEKRGELVPAGDADHGFVALATACAARLGAIPSAIASELAAERTISACEVIVRRAVDDALTDPANAGEAAAKRIAEQS